MAMDKRQTEIVEGAGLDEGRVNQDLIDFLSKWSSPLLFAMALIAGGWWFWNYRAEQKTAYRDSALVQLENATLSGNPNPVTLVALADEFSDVEGVPARALLAAGDVRLSAASRGIAPGAQVNQDGTVAEEDLLSDEDRLDEFDKAAKLYQRAWDLTKDEPAMALHAVGAASGMAAVAESLGDIEAARDAYERLIGVADNANYLQQSAVAKRRMASLEERLSEAPQLYPKSELPELYADRPLESEAAVTPLIEGSTDVVGPEAPPAETPPAETSEGDAPAAEPEAPATEPVTEPATEPATEPGDG